MKKIYFLLVQILLLYTQSTSAQVVISQIYGGGGVGGSPTYTNDFIELFNAGQTAQSLNGWCPYNMQDQLKADGQKPI